MGCPIILEGIHISLKWLAIKNTFSYNLPETVIVHKKASGLLILYKKRRNKYIKVVQ